ncbi:hypothetical protein [Streptomyces canus]|uniref:hypothetical protein n=1 Tax=Streptomyces canus TaxID=58343 RepID=UPI0003A00D16|nr:hypothetical protein [Streptomyces canus]
MEVGALQPEAPRVETAVPGLAQHLPALHLRAPPDFGPTRSAIGGPAEEPQPTRGWGSSTR